MTGRWYCIVKWDDLGEMYYYAESGVWTTKRGMAMLFPFYLKAYNFLHNIVDLGSVWKIKEF